MASTSYENKKSDGLYAFFILTYALMLLTWGIMAVFQMRAAAATDTAAPPSAFGMVLFLLGGFSPTIAGAIMAWRVQGRDGLRDLWKRFIQFRLGGVWYWYLVVILGLPLLVRGLQAVVFALRGGTFVEPPFVAQPVSLIGLTVMMFLFGPFSEEFGWRGFALDRLLTRWNALISSLMLGVLWAFWHLPLFFIPGTSQQQMGNPVAMFTGFAVEVVAMSVLFTWGDPVSHGLELCAKSCAHGSGWHYWVGCAPHGDGWPRGVGGDRGRGLWNQLAARSAWLNTKRSKNKLEKENTNEY
jgi:membrane protease YdiL (CAAX protease family)